jgi:hypothetical protein
VPGGEYIAHVTEGRLFQAQMKGTPGYKLTFVIIEGEHAGRRLWFDIWLTEKALAGAKRDLAKIGVESLDQLERPIPPNRLRCKVRVAIRRDNAGIARSEIRGFELIGVDDVKPDPFAPPAEGEKQ